MSKRFAAYTRLLLILVFSVYCVLVLIGVFHHEPWRDEAHAWVHARDASYTQILQNIGEEGVPVLWYLILSPFAKLGMPYLTMQLLHAVAAIAAVGILLFFSPLPLYVKIPFTFSYFMLYEYAIIARNYILTGLLLFIISWLYPTRLKRPIRYGVLIALLMQTNLHSFGISAILMVAFVIDCIKNRLITKPIVSAFVIMLLMSAFTLYTYLGKGSAPNYANAPSSAHNEFMNKAVKSIVIPSFQEFDIYDPVIAVFPEREIWILRLTYAVMITLLLSLLSNPLLAIISLGELFWMLYVVSVINWGGQLRHRGLILLAIIHIMWLGYRELHTQPRLLKGLQYLSFLLLSVLLAVSIIATVHLYTMDYKENFSGAKDMSTYIAGLPVTLPIVTHVSSYTQSVQAYDPHRRYWISEFQSDEYHNTSDNIYINSQIYLEDAIAKAQKHFGGTEYALLLTSPLPARYATDYTLLYATTSVLFWYHHDENYWLYKKNE